MKNKADLYAFTQFLVSGHIFFQFNCVSLTGFLDFLGKNAVASESDDKLISKSYLSLSLSLSLSLIQIDRDLDTYKAFPDF